MSKTSPRRFRVPTPAEDARIRAAAKSDPDLPPFSRREVEAMVPLRTVRGRPKSDSAKVLVSVRYSPQVLEYFRSTGEGWQSRMNGVLERYVARQTRQS